MKAALVICHQWCAEAKNITIDGLEDFIRLLTDDMDKYENRYSTICYAMVAAAIAAINSMKHCAKYELSHFQMLWVVTKLKEILHP